MAYYYKLLQNGPPSQPESPPDQELENPYGPPSQPESPPDQEPENPYTKTIVIAGIICIVAAILYRIS